jgi:16S rRNA (guanine527-N7)-methyltransferase
MTRLVKVNDAISFGQAFSVSRETLDSLIVFEDRLRRWQLTTNLVGPITLDHIWRRHMADSAQLLALAPDAKTWVDLGSGAGFPGMVIAILNANRQEFRMNLVESNAKKCAFLREAARAAQAPVEIVHSRIEDLPSATIGGADIVSARALAPLPRLMDLVSPHLGPGARALLLKGAGVEGELRAAETAYAFEHVLHSSLTDERAAIVEIAGPIRRRTETR